MVRNLKSGWTKSKPLDDFSDRYADNWRSTIAKAHKSTAGNCCYCCKASSQEVHHGYYRRLPIGSSVVWLLWFLLFPAAYLLSPLFAMVAIAAAPVVYLLPARPIKGKEIIGWDVFPVCGSTSLPGTCHHRLHRKGTWITDKRNPKWGNHNKAIVIWRLRLGFLLLKLRAKS